MEGLSPGGVVTQREKKKKMQPPAEEKTTQDHAGKESPVPSGERSGAARQVTSAIAGEERTLYSPWERQHPAESKQQEPRR